MDVVGGDHGSLAFRAGTVFDPAQDSPLALTEFVEHISFHSKVSVVWPSEDMKSPLLLPNHRGFSSFLRQMDLQDLYITLGSGLNQPLPSRGTACFTCVSTPPSRMFTRSCVAISD